MNRKLVLLTIYMFIAQILPATSSPPPPPPR